MEIEQIARTEINRLWNQIITQAGVHRYSSDEWQRIYEELMEWMLDDFTPHVSISNVEAVFRKADMNTPIKAPPLRSALVQQPVISDSLSALRIPRLKPADYSIGSVQLDQIPGDRPNNSVFCEPEPLPRQKPRFMGYMEQKPRNDQEDISPWHLQQQQKQLECQDLNSRAGGIGQVKRSPERYQHQQQFEQQDLQADSQQLNLEKVPNPQLTEPILEQDNQEQDCSLPDELPAERKRSRDTSPDSPLSPIKEIDGVMEYIQQKEGIQFFSNEVDRKKDLLSKLMSEEFSLWTSARTCNTKTDAVVDKEMENKLIEDIFQLYDKKRKMNKPSPPQTQVSPYNPDEHIDVWLQNFQAEQVPPFEVNTTAVTDFFKHLPKLPKLFDQNEEIKSVSGNVCFCEPMEEDEEPPKPEPLKKKVKKDKKKQKGRYSEVNYIQTKSAHRGSQQAVYIQILLLGAPCQAVQMLEFKFQTLTLINGTKDRLRLEANKTCKTLHINCIKGTLQQHHQQQHHQQQQRQQRQY
ncbi:hypothetical protein AWZ03_003714 [Drosophila navojoa]|uniref:Uncharacterized protein n=1 Tax=Drosophila navojoa TaxID=7232 RepID=A0A484BMH0_DRONA|nr:hypothetical protein AWZ03_003714 [Drosophila navojoa]